MSRARPVVLPDGEKVWFDVTRSGEQASDGQLELLAVITQIDIDDLLDAVITRGEVLTRLRDALGQNGIPIDVQERRRRWREHRRLQPACLKCGKEGDSTKHHFVNKWILRELADYGSKWADRSKNTIPLCVHCHRLIHQRDDSVKSIVELLNDEQREFADAALTVLSEERPKLLILIARGDEGTYETRLVRDWIEGKFTHVPARYRHLRVA
jgi:hypothetical protein